METVRLLLAAALAIVALVAFAQLVWAHVVMPSLASVPPLERSAPPSVSIIVAARDEERHMAAAAAALMSQEYPDYDVVIVDDRSTDRTPIILDDLASDTERLEVIHVAELPEGWLGKNYALHVGARHASGELLLFTDADIVFHPTALSRAVNLLERSKSDHLAVAPSMVLPTWPLTLMVTHFLMWGVLAVRAWRTQDPRSSAFMGIGAFNLVRATAYRAVGGHTRIPLRPDDDLMLGKLLKRSGARQLVAFGRELVSVEWYRTLGEATRGLRKNAFAALRYSTVLFALAVLATLASGVWPFVALLVTQGAERALYAAAVIALLAGYFLTAVANRLRPWLTPLYPVAALISVGVLIVAVTRTLRAGGIEWRGTFYPLALLRANRV